MTSPFIHYGISSSREALLDANYNTSNLTDEQRFRTGICFGSGIGCVDESASAGYLLNTSLKSHPIRSLSPYSIPKLLINLCAGHISIINNIRGINHSVSTACTTGAHSIGDAYRFIKYNDADIMIAGSSENSITPISLSLFSRMNALSSQIDPSIASRPFDMNRSGFVMGEGSACLILESLESAMNRKPSPSKIYCEIKGYGLSSDAYHITSPPSKGEGAIQCMSSALLNSSLNIKDIDYINAHATSTIKGDQAENNAIKTLFELNNPLLSISSCKGSIGHMLGGSGSIESIFTILSIYNSIIPPTLNLYSIDKNNGFTLDYTPLYAKHKNIKNAMTNSFGFGGTNASLVFSKFEL